MLDVDQLSEIALCYFLHTLIIRWTQPLKRHCSILVYTDHWRIDEIALSLHLADGAVKSDWSLVSYLGNVSAHADMAPGRKPDLSVLS